MNSPRQRRRRLVLSTMAFALIGVVGLGVAGCGGCNTSTTKNGKGRQEQSDPRTIAREILAKAGEATAFREALDQYNRYLTSDAGTAAEVRPSKDETALLEKRFHLEEDEIQEIQSRTFRPLDAHYLELCFHLRDAVRSLQLPGRPGLEQARCCFDWVCRHIVLREVRGQLLQPPLFALKRGYGSAQDRAVVFAAMMHQLNRDVAMVALPEKGSKVRYWLPGVLLETKGKGSPSDLYLFEARLGLPVPGPKGGVATLTQVKAQPELLQRLRLDEKTPYDVAAKQLEQAEVQLICPLSALAPRMRYLETDLAAHDKVRLALEPVPLFERFEAAKVGPVKVWNQRTALQKNDRGQVVRLWPVTPVRALRLNLPPDEGGVGPPNCWQRFEEELSHWAPAEQFLQRLKDERILEDVAVLNLRYLLGKIIQRFALEPRLALQRGRMDDANKRLERIAAVMEELDRAQQSDREFETKLVEWSEHMRKAALQKAAAGGDSGWNNVWAEDQYLWAVLTASEDLELKEKEYRKTVLSFLVFRALGDPMRREVKRLRALRWHEVAGRLQGKMDRPQGPKADPSRRPQLLTETNEAWDNARSEWRNYTASVPLTSAGLAAQVQRLQDALRNAPENSRDIRGKGLADFLQRELRQSASANLLLVQCQERIGDKQAALTCLEKLADQLAGLEKGQELYVLFPQDFREQGRRALFPDFEPNGSFYWLNCSARVRQRQLAGKVR